MLVHGQNLLPNPDFELCFDVPSATGDWYKCTDWYALHAPFGNGVATPDFFHVNGDFPVQLPDNSGFTGYVAPHSGLAAMGFVAFSVTTEFREYLMTRFIQPLVVGTEYELHFWICNGYADSLSPTETFAMSCDRIGILLSMDTVRQTGYEVVNRVPQLQINEDLYSPDWKEITFVFTPDSAYRYMTIGNFYPDTLTGGSLQVQGGASAYFFIDDFYFARYFEPYENPDIIPNIFTPNNDGVNDFLIPGTKEEFEEFELSVFNRWGSCVFVSDDPSISWDGTNQGTQCSEGVYFWKLNFRKKNSEAVESTGFVELVR